MHSRMSEAIARGYHFMPTEEELIGILVAFLECRAQGKKFRPGPVAEKVLYGDNATPWNIFGEDDDWESAETESGKKGVKDVLFVLTQLSSMSAKKIARTAGCGTWDGQTGVKEIQNRKGEIVGLRKMLSYKVNEGSESQPEKAQWRMHEYALAGVSLEQMKLKHIDINNYVICKVTRDYTKCRSPAKDQILGKRESEVGAETSQRQNKKLRLLMELVNSETQKDQVNEQQLVVSSSHWVNNTYPTAAVPGFHHWTNNIDPPWPAESTFSDSSPLSPVESTANTSYLPSAAESATNTLYLPLEAESRVNYSFPPSAGEVSSDYCVIPPAAEAEAEARVSTTSDPEGGVDYMNAMELFNSLVDLDLDIMGLTDNIEFVRNQLLLVRSEL